jgi:pimeloyl-ACP methyl ester carboxylesterase
MTFILLRTIAVIAGLLAVAAALAAAILAVYYGAVFIAQTSILTVIALVAFAAIAWLGIRLGAALWRSDKAARFASISAGALTLVFFIALYSMILRPIPLRYTDALPAENGKYWHLPTGSTISYQELLPPVGVAVKPEPIVFLHGGPGVRFMPWDSPIYGAFAADGFRVYLYDQAGSGASALLPHSKDYTIERFVEDLEAVRLQLHADRMILIGHSWGSLLAASYMAKYPTHVSKAVFHSPAPIWPGASSTLQLDSADMSRTDFRGGSLALSDIPIRLLAGLFLLERNPDAADHLLPQRQAQELMVPVIIETKGTVVCKGNSSKLPPLFAGIEDHSANPGFNPYVNERLTDQTKSAQGDPHAALRGNRTPAILLFGECNFVPWEGAVDYRKTFATLKVFYIPKAGHYIQFEQPDLMSKVIRSFLLDQSDAIPAYTNDADPRLDAK